ncbi:hypothetical protein G9A89_002877 [Geosiphon pyriformis]|nr:hypothetical protein G9A89_002877 [Geosiphon pyriformis]
MSTTTNTEHDAKNDQKRRTYSFVELIAYRYSPLINKIECKFRPEALYMNLLVKEQKIVDIKMQFFVTPPNEHVESPTNTNSDNLLAVMAMLKAHIRWKNVLQNRCETELKANTEKEKKIFANPFECKSVAWFVDHMQEKGKHSEDCVAMMLPDANKWKAENVIFNLSLN